jgi:hypothetical protein
MEKPQSDDAPQGVEEVLGELDELAAARPRVCIGDVLDDFGKRSFGLFILIPPLIELSPIGGIPGVPTFLALIIAITAVQLFLGKDHVWMPQFIQQRAVSGRHLHRALMKLRGIAHWLDERSHGRLENLTQGVWTRVATVVIVVLCCTVPPLEFIPFASSAPMLAIAAFGLAITARDGVLMLIALTLAGAALGAGGFLLATNPIG